MKDLTKQWYTETTYVDKETGEIITKFNFKENYNETDREQQTDHERNVKSLTIIGRRTGQFIIEW